MELETSKNISEKLRPGRFETTTYVVDKDHYLTLPRARRILCSRNSPSNFSFLGQGVDIDHSVQLFFGDPGRSPVASVKLFGHFNDKLEKRINGGLKFVTDMHKPASSQGKESIRAYVHVKPDIDAQVKLAV